MIIVKAIDQLFRGFIKILTVLHLRSAFTVLIRGFVRTTSTLFFIVYNRFTVHGYRYIPKSGGVLIAANHQSYLDPLLVGISIFRKLTFVSKKENFGLLIAGPLMELGGAYPIDRQGKGEELDFFVNLLKKGHMLVIYPEGTIPAEESQQRSDIQRETGLLRGKTGPIRLALEAKVPIVPLGITGSGKSLTPEAVPKGQRIPIPFPNKITMRFGKPIDLSRYYGTPTSRELLRNETDKLMGKISQLVDHTENFIPFTVPVSSDSYHQIKAFESSPN